MRKSILTKITLLLLVTASFTACKKDEPSNPSTTNNPPAVNNKPNLIADKWITKKVYKNGAEQQGHFLLESIYTFKDNGSYTFLIPGAGNAAGTWSFDNAAQDKLKLLAQGTTTIWNIKTLTATSFIIEETDGSSSWKYEFSHP